MSMLEKIIENRIEHAQKYLKPLINPAIRAHHEVMIRVLQTAPRSEPEVKKMLDQKRQELHKATKRDDAEPISNEIDALEWLHSLLVLESEKRLHEHPVV